MKGTFLEVGILLYLVNFAQGTEETKIVTIQNGKIAGRILQTFSNKTYYAFQEIPYAVPPVGPLRFKEPVPATNWDDILNTTKNTKTCPQLFKNNTRENEDCLYLNVYTPVNPENVNTSLSVYVWFHGGVFMYNDATFDSFGPQYFMDEGVILVTVEFRLGPLGFLCLADGTIPCNLGLKDQNLALKWVRDNIRAFGGDLWKVTIGGQSSGSCSVGHHVISKQSAGLFRGAIMQSGSPVNPKMFQRDPTYYAFQLGAILDSSFDPNNSSKNQLVQILMNADVKDFKKATLPIPLEKKNAVVDSTVWSPAEEHDSETAFIVGPMHDNIKQGNINRISLLIGVNSEEEILFLKPKVTLGDTLDLEGLQEAAKLFDKDAENLINGYLHIEQENKLPAGEKLKKVYTNSTFEEDFGSFVRFVSDAKYATASARHGDLQSMYTDVYFYQFSYNGPLGQNNFTVEGAETVGHGEENKYLFGVNSYTNLDSFPEADIKTHQRLLRLWTNFIKYMNPTPEQEELLDKIIWPKLTPNKFVYLNINETLTLETDVREYKKWEAIYDEYAKESQITY